MWDHLRDFVGVAPALILWAWCGGIAVRRAGFSRWWGLFMLLPPAGIALIWVFAYTNWPNLPRIPRPQESSAN